MKTHENSSQNCLLDGESQFLIQFLNLLLCKPYRKRISHSLGQYRLGTAEYCRLGTAERLMAEENEVYERRNGRILCD